MKRPQKNDINPANYGFNRPADRKSRDWHPAANLPNLPKPSIHVINQPQINRAVIATSHMSSTFREVDPASIWHRPTQSQVGNTGQRVGRIRQKMEMGPDGKPILQMNIGQKRFGLVEPTAPKPIKSEEHSPRKRRKRPSTTVLPETTTKKVKISTTTKKVMISSTTKKPTTTKQSMHPEIPKETFTTPSTTTSTTVRQLTDLEIKKQKLRERISKLTPEEQREFFEKRRKKKQQREASLNNV